MAVGGEGWGGVGWGGGTAYAYLCCVLLPAAGPAHCPSRPCPPAPLTGTIMVTESAQTPFSSLSRVGAAADGTPVHKLFSQGSLFASEELSKIFRPGYTVLTHRGWRAYPRWGGRAGG